MTDAPTPLSQRRRDWFFVVALALFSASSVFSDGAYALGITSGSFGKANAAYVALAGDSFFASNPVALRVRMLVSALLFAPVTAYLSYAIYRGVARARPVALLYAGTMTVSVLEFFGWEWGSGVPPTNLVAFFGVNGPYLVVPILLAVRMWRPRPFGREEG